MNSKRHARTNLKAFADATAALDLSAIRNALEVGCGAGDLAAHLSQSRGWNITGTDVDPTQVEVARRRHDSPNVLFRTADATALPFKDGQFDFVYSLKVLHHIAAWPKALAEIHRVLKPDGLYLLNDIALSSRMAKLRQLLRKRYGVYVTDDLQAGFEGLGGETLRCEASKFALFGRASLIFLKK